MPQGQVAGRGHWLPEGDACLSVAPAAQHEPSLCKYKKQNLQIYQGQQQKVCSLGLYVLV